VILKILKKLHENFENFKAKYFVVHFYLLTLPNAN